MIHNCLFAQVRWFKDGAEIRKGKKYEIIAKGLQRILIISKAVFDDEAEYECDARTSKSSGMLTVVGEFYFSHYSTINQFYKHTITIQTLITIPFALQRRKLDLQRTYPMLRAQKPTALR